MDRNIRTEAIVPAEGEVGRTGLIERGQVTRRLIVVTQIGKAPLRGEEHAEALAHGRLPRLIGAVAQKTVRTQQAPLAHALFAGAQLFAPGEEVASKVLGIFHCERHLAPGSDGRQAEQPALHRVERRVIDYIVDTLDLGRLPSRADGIERMGQRLGVVVLRHKRAHSRARTNRSTSPLA